MTLDNITEQRSPLSLSLSLSSLLQRSREHKAFRDRAPIDENVDDECISELQLVSPRINGRNIVEDRYSKAAARDFHRGWRLGLTRGQDNRSRIKCKARRQFAVAAARHLPTAFYSRASRERFQSDGDGDSREDSRQGWTSVLRGEERRGG